MSSVSSVFAFLGGLVLIAHIYTIIRTGREKRATQPTPEFSDTSRALIGALSATDGLVIGFFSLFFCLFELRWYMKIAYLLAGLLSVGLLLGLMFQWFNIKRFAAWLACALLVGGCIGGVTAHDNYIRSITLREYFDYQTYEPFREDSLVQTPDEKATLLFSKDDALPRMDGATALYPVYAAFCQAVYPEPDAEDHEFYWDTITCSSTTMAYRNIVDSSCDIIFVARPSEEQEAYAAEKGVELVYTPIGREAFVFFVHPDNPVEGLTLDQIRGIYSGEITRWDQLGVEGLGEILAYQRDEGSGSQTALERFVMRDTPLMPADREKTLDGMGDIIDRVSAYQNHRNAIGFSFRFYSTALMKDFDVKLLEINGVAPTIENIENGTYPLASSFYAVTRSDADANTLALLDWICGEQGQALIRKTGYSPIASEP